MIKCSMLNNNAPARISDSRQTVSSSQSDIDSGNLLDLLGEFRDILYDEEDEVCGEVNVEKLRESARRGIPDEIRGHVWRILLVPSAMLYSTASSTSTSTAGSSAHSDDGLNKLGGDDEMISNSSSVNVRTTSTSRGSDSLCLFDGECLGTCLILDSHQARRLKGDISRFSRRHAKELGSNALAAIENVVATYVSRNTSLDTSEFSSLLYLCAPIVHAMGVSSAETAPESMMAFEGLMNQLQSYGMRKSVEERVAHFLSLFRLLQPELYHYFEQEEVSREWLTSWFRYLLSRELPLVCVQRLWDLYFSHPCGLELHEYVCLAVLARCKESMEDLDNSEIASYLARLPRMDMNEVIHHALNIKHQVEVMDIF
eukprot:Partr_v1_DN26802_c0_g1_i1_m40664 putative Pfam:TBC